MNINTRVYFIIICLLLILPIKQAMTDEDKVNKMLPKLLAEPKGMVVEPDENAESILIKLKDAITGKDLKFEINVNGKAGNAPVAVNFKANENINVKINNPNYLASEYNYVLKGGDSNKDFVIYCYPNLAIVKGDVLNPDGSIPENVEIRYQDEMPENYYPGYHKLRNYIDSEGKYFFVLPASSVQDKAKIEIKTNKYKFTSELSLMKSQPIKTEEFEVPVFEAEIAMPDESMKEDSVEDVLSTLNFESNGKLSFEQAYKIEKVAELGDYELIISTYVSCYKFAEDDTTRAFIKARLLPILLDSVKQAELLDNVQKGLELAKQGLEIFENNQLLGEFIEIFEYKNIPAKLKADLNDAFTEFSNKNYVKSYYLMKVLSVNPQLTEKLRAKVVNAFKESRDQLINRFVEKATDYFKNKEYLKSLWEIDKASEYSKDVAYLKLLAERNIAKLKEMNQTSKYACPLRKEWTKTEGDFDVDNKLEFAESGSKWFLLSVDNYSQVKIEFPMKNIENISYLFNIYIANEETLEPGTEVFSFDSNNVNITDKKGFNVESRTGVTIEDKVEGAKSKENEKPTSLYGKDYHQESLGQFVFAQGKYFIKIESNSVNEGNFENASCGLVLNISQLADESEMKIKAIEPGTGFDSATPLNQGFYTPFSIAPGASHWYVIDAGTEKHLVLNFAGLEDYSSLAAKVYLLDENNIINPVRYDSKAGVYVYKLENKKYHIEIENVGDSKIDFSMLVRLSDSSLFEENKAGNSFDNAIPLTTKTQKNVIRRNRSIYYKFKIARRTYINLNINAEGRESDLEMRIYSEDEEKNRTLISTTMGQRYDLYFGNYMDVGLYYIVVKSNSLRDHNIQVRLSGGISVISTGKKFADPIRIPVDGLEKIYEVKNDDEVWLQLETDDFGELKIDYRLSESKLEEDQFEKLSVTLHGDVERDVIQQNMFNSKNEKQSLTKIVGKGIYHVLIKNESSSTLKFAIGCSMSKAQEINSFDKALSIPIETVYGLVTVKSDYPKYFKLNIPDKGILQFYSIFKFNKGDVNLKLYDSERKLVVASETKNNDELLKAEVVKGEYYLEVENVTSGLENQIKLNIYYDNGENTVTSAELWDIKIPEDVNQSSNFEHETKFLKTSFNRFKLNRRRRMQFTFIAESEQAEYSIRIYHGNEIIHSAKSQRGKCYMDSEVEAGIYFVQMLAGDKVEEEISLKIKVMNKPSVSSMRGEFDNVTRDSAIKITKTSMFPIVYQGEQSLWYRIAANPNIENLEVALHCQDEKYEYILSLYGSDKEEPIEVKYSNEYPVVMKNSLRSGLVYYVKLEPVDPVPSSKIVLAFMVGPNRFRTNNLSYPFPLSSGKPENHKINREATAYYVMCFAGQTKYKITCTFTGNNSPDLDIALHKISGEIIADSEGTGNTETIDGELEPGIYRLAVKSNSQYWGETDYTVQADYEIIGPLLSPITAKDEKNVTWQNTNRSKAIQISADQKVEGTASSVPAWYSIYLDNNAKVTIKMEHDVSISDLNVFLVNSQDFALASSTSDKSIELIQRECTSDVYYIKVASFNDSKENKFSMIVTVEDVGGGHSMISAIVTELKPSDKEDDRKFEVNVDTTMKTGFDMWYVLTFEKPVWVQVSGSIKGGSGEGTLQLQRQSDDVAKPDQTEIVGALSLIDVNVIRWRRVQTEAQSMEYGLPAGTYYFVFKGNFSTGKIKLTGTYINGITNKAKAPVVGSGTFSNLKITAKSDFWFKVKSANTFKIVSSIYSEADIANIKLVLQSDKVDVCEAFTDSKSAIIFSEVAAGEYYIMIKNITDKDIVLNRFQIMVLDDSHFFGKAKLLKANSKASGTFERNSEELKMYLFVLTEESNVKFSLKLSETRSNAGMSIAQIAPQGTEGNMNRFNNNRGNIVEQKLKAGVYILYMYNNYYYNESGFILEYELQGSDFNE